MPYPGIFRVTCPTPFPGLPHVHVYMCEGPDGGLVVIDTALPFEDSYERIVEGVRFVGRDLEDIESIYLTHAHPDHFGCAGMLQEASGAPVVCHPLCAKTLQAMASPDPGRIATMTRVYAEHGRSPEQMIESRASAFFSMMAFPTQFKTIDEGDDVSFAQSKWDVYWTPGHEEGHIVLHRPDDGVLVVGDTVLAKITPHIGWMVEPADPLGQFLESLDKVGQLDPSLVLPGHGRPFDKGAARARAISAHHAFRLRRCTEILARNGPLSAMEVARELFDRELMFFEERLALAETLSHLEYLRLRNRIGRDMVDGVWRYRVA